MGPCLFSEGGNLVRSLWRHDITISAKSVLAGPPPSSTTEGEVSREEELRRERARLRELGVTGYQWAKDAVDPTLLVAANRGMITRFEKKIQATLARVWGEEKDEG